MANPFYHIVKQRINPIVKPFGFRIRDRFYQRIINSVVQQSFIDSYMKQKKAVTYAELKWKERHE